MPTFYWKLVTKTMCSYSLICASINSATCILKANSPTPKIYLSEKVDRTDRSSTEHWFTFCGKAHACQFRGNHIKDNILELMPARLTNKWHICGMSLTCNEVPCTDFSVCYRLFEHTHCPYNMKRFPSISVNTDQLQMWYLFTTIQ